MTTDLKDVASRREWRRSLLPDRLAYAFVVLALGALVVIPIVINKQIANARDESIAVVETARSTANRIQLELANEIGMVRSGQPERDLFDAAVRSEDSLLIHLTPAAARLGGAVATSVDALRANLDAWHAHAARRLAIDGAMEFDETVYRRALNSASQLNEALRAASQRRTFEMRRMEELKLRLSYVAVILAFLAAAMVGWLSRRMRLVAEEAWRRRVEVESLMESKARLMHGITHDIKNPLGAIDGHAQLLEDGIKGELSAPQRESIVRIRRNVRSSLSIISDLLEMARAETRQLNLDLADVDVVQLTSEAVEDHRAELESRELALDFHASAENRLVNTDADRVRAILGNLLSNAAKYTPRGGHVQVSVTSEKVGPARQPGPWIALSVRDNGPGIPVDRREFIFEEFARLESGTRGGAGLGLAISRKIARLMGGDITVGSAPDQGSIFTLWLRATTMISKENMRQSARTVAVVFAAFVTWPVAQLAAQTPADGPVAAQAALAPKLSRMRDLTLASELARYGKTNNEPLALLAAARIVLDVGWEPLGTTEDGSNKAAPEPDFLDAASILSEAKRLAAGQPTILALVAPLQDRAARTPRGAEGGIKLAGGKLPARGLHSYKVTFVGGQPAAVYVAGSRESASSFECAIFDGRGRKIDSKEDVECVITWWPDRRETYRIEVRNARRSDQQYLFMTN